MSFSFGFFNEDANKSYNMVTNSVFSSVQEDVVHGTIPGIRDAVKNHFPLEMFETGGDIVYSPVVYGGFDFKKVEVQQNEDSIDKKSDIIPGVYEGGNKVWECSVDLAVLLLQNKHNIISPNSGKVLELGCGHGFPGIAALRLGYQQVVFSDLNGEVIDSATWPNIFLNCPDTMARAMCYSGDWEGLSTELFSR